MFTNIDIYWNWTVNFEFSEVRSLIVCIHLTYLTVFIKVYVESRIIRNRDAKYYIQYMNENFTFSAL